MIDEHIRSFDDLYRGLSCLNLEAIRFPLTDIEAFRWNRGRWNDAYYSYHYRRFTCHTLSRLAPAAGQSLLVVGCGFGLDEKNIKSLFRDTDSWSIDASRNMLRLAVASGSPSRFSQALAEKLPFPNGCFDRVLSREVIEHVIHPDVMLKEISRVLKPGGIAVITTENEESLGPTNYWDSHIREKLAALLGLPLEKSQYKDDAPTVAEMKLMIEAAGLELVEYFFDGALYKYLIEITPLLKARTVPVAHFFSQLENGRLPASLFCDQIKYVLRKPPGAAARGSGVHYACIRCTARLEFATDWSCPTCGARYPVTDNIPDFAHEPGGGGAETPTALASAQGIRLHQALFWRLINLLRSIYCLVYLAGAWACTAFTKSNRAVGSRLLPAEDPYRQFLRVP